jgi:hypothetical protein
MTFEMEINKSLKSKEEEADGDGSIEMMEFDLNKRAIQTEVKRFVFVYYKH